MSSRRWCHGGRVDDRVAEGKGEDDLRDDDRLEAGSERWATDGRHNNAAEQTTSERAHHLCSDVGSAIVERENASDEEGEGDGRVVVGATDVAASCKRAQTRETRLVSPQLQGQGQGDGCMMMMAARSP